MQAKLNTLEEHLAEAKEESIARMQHEQILVQKLNVRFTCGQLKLCMSANDLCMYMAQ